MNQKFRKITIFVSFHPKTLNISASVSMCNNANNLQHCKLQLPVSQRSSRSLTEVEIAPMPKSLLLESWWRPEVSRKRRKNRLWLSFGDPNRMRSSGPSGWADTPRTGTPSPSSKLGKRYNISHVCLHGFFQKVYSRRSINDYFLTNLRHLKLSVG